MFKNLSENRYSVEELKATIGWSDEDGEDSNGTDIYGFTALSGGYDFGGRFSYIGESGHWWTASEYDNYSAYEWEMRQSYYGNGNNGKGNMFNIRCVQN